MTNSDETSTAVVVRLIDPNHGRPLQEWRFESASEITIGRSEDSDIVIPDPQVSRLHVVLKFSEKEWWLLSLGRNGVLVDGLMVDDLPTGADLTFRMGSNGPLLSFSDSSLSAENCAATAQTIDLNEMADLQLDHYKLEENVREITDGEFFQKLASQASEFRQRKRP